MRRKGWGEKNRFQMILIDSDCSSQVVRAVKDACTLVTDCPFTLDLAKANEATAESLIFLSKMTEASKVNKSQRGREETEGFVLSPLAILDGVSEYHRATMGNSHIQALWEPEGLRVLVCSAASTFSCPAVDKPTTTHGAPFRGGERNCKRKLTQPRIALR